MATKKNVKTIQLGRNGVFGSIDIDLDAVPTVSAEYVNDYGWRQVINDSFSAVTEKAFPDPDVRLAEINAKVAAKVAALMSGAIRVQADPVEREMIDIWAEKVSLTDAFESRKAMREWMKGKNSDALWSWLADQTGRNFDDLVKKVKELAEKRLAIARKAAEQASALDIDL